MSESVTNAGNKLWEMRIAIFWFLLFSINALCTSITAALVGSNWAELDGQGKLMIFLAVGGNWTGTIMAFVSRESSRIKKTGELLPDDYRETRTATVSQTVSQTSTEAK